ERIPLRDGVRLTATVYKPAEMNERLPEGTVAVHSEEPQPCVQCGQIPEQVVEVIETAVEPCTKSPQEAPQTEAATRDSGRGNLSVCQQRLGRWVFQQGHPCQSPIGGSGNLASGSPTQLSTRCYALL